MREPCFDARGRVDVGTNEGRYDIGRNYIVGNMTGQVVDSKLIRPGYRLQGSVTKRGWKYTTTVDWDDTLLEANRSKCLAPLLRFRTRMSWSPPEGADANSDHQPLH
jgi:hypothetical protein